MIAFADATGDVNPLHVSVEFARRTPYGRPIVHGALVALAAMTAQGTAPLEVPGRLVLQFRRPVFPGRRYVVHPVAHMANGWSLTVTDAGTPAVIVRAGRPPGAATRPGDTVASTDGGPATWADRYCLADPAGLRALLRQFGDEVPEQFVLPLSWASWFTGMVMPGRDALLSQIVAGAVGDADAGLDWQARLTRDDPRFGSVATSATVSTGGSSGGVYVEAFRRPASPAPTRAGTAALLREGTQLRGTAVLLVGGSRGIGAALTAAFASQGATVHVAYARSAAQVEALRVEFGPELVRPLQMDATDAESVARAVARLTEDGVALDGVVLCAAPPLQAMPVHADTASDAFEHIEAALRMAWLPLAHTLPLLSRGTGWIVVFSSAALQDPPPHWAHYVAAKGALEGLATSLARDAGVAVLVARPPRVWTDLTNGPGVAGDALSPGEVAVPVVRWVLDGPAVTGSSTLLEPETFSARPQDRDR